MAKLTVRDLDVNGKKVLVRVDFNVPRQEGVITDDNRIVCALPTINYLLENNAKVILFSHLGKVNHKDAEKTEADKAKNDMKVVGEYLSKVVDAKVTYVNATRGQELEDAINAMNNSEIVLMQNTRYEKGESKNDPELSKYWASLADCFVIDAFGSVHRAHSSTVGVAELLPSGLGFLVEKEVKALSEALENPKRPLVAILGGAKVSDKIAVIDNLLNIADKVIIGGGMAYTFYKAQGLEIGNSLLEEDKISLAKEYLDKAKDKLILPVDSVVANDFANPTDVRVEKEVPAGYLGLDIGPESVELFKKEIADAKTIIWNGPMGVFEREQFSNGTKGVCKAIAELDCMSVIGGGDSASAAINFGFKDDFSHISTGGGASLEYMEGKILPGIDVIKEK